METSALAMVRASSSPSTDIASDKIVTAASGACPELTADRHELLEGHVSYTSIKRPQVTALRQTLEADMITVRRSIIERP